MAIRQGFVKIKKNGKNNYDLKSTEYDKSKLAECELMTILGAIFGVSITNPNLRDGSSFTINIILNSPE